MEEISKPIDKASSRLVIPAKTWLGLLLAGLYLMSSMAMYGQSLVDKIMASLERTSNNTQQFRVQARMLSRKPQRAEDLNTGLLLYVARNSGTQKSLGKIVAPERSKGQIFLNNTRAYWAFYPKLKRSMPLSPLSTLAGDVSIGDILAPPPLQIYSAKVLKSDEQKVTLEFTKEARSAPYARVVQHYESDVLKNAEFYGGQKGDILLKRAQYLKPINFDDGYFYTQVKILNALEKGSYTVITFSTPKDIEIPEAWFNPNNLEQVP